MGLMDLKQRKSFDKLEKFCDDCKTTKTPLWRSGPAGPKSLCNACGIRYRKTRRASMALKNTNQSEKKKKKSTAVSDERISGCSSSSTGQGISSPNELNKSSSSSLKLRLMVLRNEVLIERSPFLSSGAPVVKKQRCQRRISSRDLSEEEEQAAFSLMALSCASISIFA